VFFSIKVVYHNFNGHISLMSKVFFLLKMLASLSSLLGAWVVYIEVMRPFAKMAMCTYVFLSLGKG
jgi:hypothetical protein